METTTLPVFDSLGEIVYLVRASRHIFIRYSRDPWEDLRNTSYDYEADLPLPGLSVTVLCPEAWWTRPIEDWVARRMCKYLELAEADSGNRPWLLTGTIVGNGPDHEPLVADVLPIGWVGPTALGQADERYRQRFHVGRSSADTRARPS